MHSLSSLLKSDYSQFRSLASGIKCHRRQSFFVLKGFFHPRIAPVAWYRVAHWLHTHGFKRLGALISFVINILFRVEIPARALIGPGLVLPHPMGIVIGSAIIGTDVTIFQNVTLGAKQFDGDYDLSVRPCIGNNVIIGSGAVILGSTNVGDCAVVGANSLVLNDVPAKALAIGVPAENKIIKK